MNEMMSSLLFFKASNQYKSPICLFYDDGHGGVRDVRECLENRPPAYENTVFSLSPHLTKFS